MDKKSKNVLCAEGAKREREFMSGIEADACKDFTDPEKANKKYAKALRKTFLELDISQLDDLLKVVKGTAQATGQSFQYTFDNIVLGIDCRSKLILDNSGIPINTEKANKKFAVSIRKTAQKLTDTEKKQAFFNACIEQGLENREKH